MREASERIPSAHPLPTPKPNTARRMTLTWVAIGADRDAHNFADWSRARPYCPQTISPARARRLVITAGVPRPRRGGGATKFFE